MSGPYRESANPAGIDDGKWRCRQCRREFLVRLSEHPVEQRRTISCERCMRMIVNGLALPLDTDEPPR